MLNRLLNYTTIKKSHNDNVNIFHNLIRILHIIIQYIIMSTFQHHKPSTMHPIIWTQTDVDGQIFGRASITTSSRVPARITSDIFMNSGLLNLGPLFI